MENIKEIADKIFTLKNEIKSIEDEQKAFISKKKDLLESLQQEFVDRLHVNGLRSVKTENANFSLASRKSISITNPITALKWSIENNTVAVDKKLFDQKVKELEDLPDFVEVVEKDSLTVKNLK